MEKFQTAVLILAGGFAVFVFIFMVFRRFWEAAICPHCREPVHKDAIACPHCARDIAR